jgi:bifunctional non-homologous end joining protein LigD
VRKAEAPRWAWGSDILTHMSHVEKLYWPAEGLTKLDMLNYYRQVAGVMLPHLADRPVTLRMYPDGIQGHDYYRRDLPDHAPSWLQSIDYAPETGSGISKLLIDDAKALIWLADQGAIEFHPWAAKAPDLAVPDQAILDLDPGDEAGFDEVLEAAQHLYERLQRMGLQSFPKTSGGRGLHVYLPLEPGYSFANVRGWVKGMAEEMASAFPELVEVAHGATHRGRRVTIDHAQNSIGRNTAAPYTLRALPGAPASTPLTWEEVHEGRIRPLDFTLRTLPERVERVGDLFAPILKTRQRLP